MTYGKLAHDHVHLELIANQVGIQQLEAAFRANTFVYGSMGSGSIIVSGLKRWAARPRKVFQEFEAKQNPKQDIYFGQNVAQKNAANRNPLRRAQVAPSPRPDHPSTRGREQVDQGMLRKTLQRELNLFDPGRRAHFYIESGCQMMDLYYGQAGTNLHEKRIPIIAEFVHYAMQWSPPFSMEESGRDAYMREFNTTIEGYKENSPSVNRYNGLTATKEMSRIIRWGISRFGGKLIFEGREIYYSQVFAANPDRIGDTDLEARELFKHFAPGASAVPFGSGRIIFHWSGRQTVPTKVHFLTNWTWHNNEVHQSSNIAKASFLRNNTLLPIWDNFDTLPKRLNHYSIEVIGDQLKQLSGSI